MTPLLPLLLPLVMGTVSAETPTAPGASASPPGLEADLVEVHLGANTPGVRLVVRPPASAGPDAQPYVVEVFVPPWPDTAQEAAPAATPSLADEPVAAVPVMLAAPTTMASAVPTASYATQPIEPTVATDGTAFLRHASADELLPPSEPAAPQLGAIPPQPLAPPAPEATKEAIIPETWLAAADHFEKACESGYAEACGSLAQMVADGQAGPPDMQRAYELYQRGCDHGDDASCQAIAPTPAVQVTAGAAVADAAPAVAVTGAATQPATAPAFAVERDLFDACQRGDNGACNELGERHTHGDGVSLDYERAAKLFQRACAGGEMTACTNLGILYKVGEGVSHDDLRAERLFQLACNGGDGDERACGLAEE
jgi:hypothetical protein